MNVHEAKTHFSKLIDAAHAGETILVAKGVKPWARLVPLEQPRPRRQQLLLDTHAVYVSAASGWEIATKVRLGKLPGIGDLLNDLPQLLIAQGFELLPITLQQGLHAGSYPMPHRDPFDRLLAAQAELAMLTLVTLDPALQAFPCRLLW